MSDSGRQTSTCALLAPGFEASFISKRATQQLFVKRYKVDVTVSDLQGIDTGRVTPAVSFHIGSEYSSDSKILLLTAYVLPKLTLFNMRKHIGRYMTYHESGHVQTVPEAECQMRRRLIIYRITR